MKRFGLVASRSRLLRDFNMTSRGLLLCRRTSDKRGRFCKGLYHSANITASCRQVVMNWMLELLRGTA